MGTYNRRLAQIARRRRRLGLLGRMNCGMRHLIPGFTLKRSDMFRLFPMLGEWAWLELKEGWRSWGETAEQVQSSHPVHDSAMPAPAAEPSMG
jgi:hypothetical protein